MTIIVGYTPRPEGLAALERGIWEATRSEEPLVVLNSSRGDAAVDERFAQEHHLVDARMVLEASGVEYELRQQVRGRDAAEEILTAAEETGASLIVVGIRHRTPVGKLILGSTSQRVLLDAPCPVVAVKARRA